MNDASELEVRIGRGVVKYVNGHGGQLYVWVEPFGGAFDRVRATIEPPEGVELKVVRHVTEFVLHVQEGVKLKEPIGLVRRWWGLGRGIDVQTSAVSLIA